MQKIRSLTASGTTKLTKNLEIINLRDFLQCNQLSSLLEQQNNKYIVWKSMLTQLYIYLSFPKTYSKISVRSSWDKQMSHCRCRLHTSYRLDYSLLLFSKYQKHTKFITKTITLSISSSDNLPTFRLNMSTSWICSGWTA